MTFAQVLQLVGFPAITSAIVLSIYNRLLKKKDARDDKIQEINVISTHVDQIEAEVRAIRDKELEDHAAIQALKMGQQSLLRDRIVNQYNKYIEKGYMPIYAKESLDHMYDSYKQLGGNGVIESLMEKLYQLPTEEKF